MPKAEDSGSPVFRNERSLQVVEDFKGGTVEAAFTEGRFASGMFQNVTVNVKESDLEVRTVEAAFTEG